MAFIQCEFFSEVLDLKTTMNVILPQPSLTQTEPRRQPATLYLLHGLSDNHTIWSRKTSIERYVQHMNLAVIMPAVHRSWYTDMAAGYRYWTFISEEVPAVARALFWLSDKREDNFVAGLSMGGYGAFKLALTHPERYVAAASLSGALDVVAAARAEDEKWQAEMSTIFGDLDRLAGSGNDLFHLVRQAAGVEPQPLLYQCCGAEDFLHEDNIRFKNLAASLNFDLTYEEGPGEHEWAYWDRQIQRVLDWLPLPPAVRQFSAAKHISVRERARD